MWYKDSEREGGREGEREKARVRKMKEDGEREIHLEIVSASVWPLAYWN